MAKEEMIFQLTCAALSTPAPAKIDSLSEAQLRNYLGKTSNITHSEIRALNAITTAEDTLLMLSRRGYL